MKRTRSKYARRPRDFVFMLFVKSLPCSVQEEWPGFPVPPTACRGITEADHMGERGLGQKADDRTCAPMCMSHHRERTDHSGTFFDVPRDHEREWRGSRHSAHSDDVCGARRRVNRVTACG